MKNNERVSIPLNNSYTLVRWDLLKFEEHLRNTIAQILPFESHAIYFPKNQTLTKAEWIPEEKKLLLPLWYNNALLGVFMARNPEPSLVQTLLPILSKLTVLWLNNLELYKKGRLDLLTGLITRQTFIQYLIEETTDIQKSCCSNMYSGKENNALYKSSVGIVIFRFNGLAKIACTISHDFVEQIISELANIFINAIPNHTTPARTGDYEFALLIPEATTTQCLSITKKVISILKKYKKTTPLSYRQIGINPYAGYVIYPQDMDRTKQITIDTHAKILLHKAGIAAEIAYSHLSQTQNPIMAYGKILIEGGEIRQLLSHSCMIINLGRNIGAREGQRFSVFSSSHHTQKSKTMIHPQPIYKGDIVILEAKETESIAEALHLGDPRWQFEVGDTLTIITDEYNASTYYREYLDKATTTTTTTTTTTKIDPITGLLSYRTFFTHFSESKEMYPKFVLTIVHIANTITTSTSQKQSENLLRQISTLCNNSFPISYHEGLFSGRFALNSLIFFHPNIPHEELYIHYSTLAADLTQSLGIKLGIGIAYWPFLHLRTSDILECCQRALEYALLLPPPCVGIFNSLAINISADKKHCYGDLFSAIEEYKLALLADETNALAWNSLGVCMASLGKYTEAQQHFEKALYHLPTDPMISYNLGVLYQTVGDIQLAYKYFHTCLSLSPSHFYAIIRLGTLAEASKNIQEAIRYFNQAISLNNQHALPYRHLATIALNSGQKEKAREYLHQALLKNPHDATTLTLMAKIYLDSEEDPELAEVLCRQSVAYEPKRKAGWVELARSLEIQGRDAEAHNIWIKAKEC